jgi:tetratricopeptide (TPR) repeat protein
LKPWSADLYFGRAAARHGLIGQDKEKREKAIADYSEAIKRNSDFSSAYYARGVIASDINDLESAISDFSAAIKIDKNWKNEMYKENSFFGKSTVFLQRCVVYQKKNLLREAVEDCTEAIQIKKDYAIAYNFRGTIYEKQAEISKAIDDYTASIDSKCPDIWIPYTNRGLLKIQKGDYDEALKDFKKSIDVNSKYAHAWYGRGLVYSKMKPPKAEKAIKEFNQALIFTSYAFIFKDRGRVYADLGDHKRAIEDYGQAILMDQSDPETYQLRCEANVAVMALDDARQDCNKASDLYRQKNEIEKSDDASKMTTEIEKFFAITRAKDAQLEAEKKKQKQTSP